MTVVVEQPINQLAPEKPKVIGKYGWKSFTPAWLQKFHRAKYMLAVAAFCAFTQAMQHDALIPVSLTSLEKRFRLDGFALGLFVAAYDIAVLTCLIPICHFGGRGHKGRWLAGGMVIIALGSFICTVPQFISKTYSYNAKNVSNAEVCQPNFATLQTATSDIFDEPVSEEPYWLYFQLLLLGQCLNGVGSTPLYTIGVTYIDESVTHENSALFLSIFYSCSLLGVVPGFVVGGGLLSIYGDVGKTDVSLVAITHDDQQWYGAWWIGFLMISVLSLIGAFLMAGFAETLPDAPNLDSEKRPTAAMKVATSWEDLCRGMAAVFKSTTFLFLITVEIFESVLSTGVVNFFPKIMQSFFSISSSKASVISGATIVPAAVIGNLVGGTLVRKLHLDTTGMLVMAVVADVSSMVFGLCFLLYCPTADIAGVTVHYEPVIYRSPEIVEYSHLPSFKQSGLPNLTNWCNDKCYCDQAVWEPVCDPYSQMTYFSPCYAGCGAETSKSSRRNRYSECSCLAREAEIDSVNASISEFEYSIGEMKTGFCQKACTNMYAFFGCFGVFVMMAFMSAIPIQESQLRTVPFEERSLAYGMRWMVMRIFGTIPGPLIFGKFVDYACMVWKVDREGYRQDCPIYDNDLLSKFILSIGTVLKLLVIGCLMIAWKLSRRHATVAPGSGITRGPTPVPRIKLRRATHFVAETPESTEGKEFVSEAGVSDVEHMTAPTTAGGGLAQPQKDNRKTSSSSVGGGSRDSDGRKTSSPTSLRRTSVYPIKGPYIRASSPTPLPKIGATSVQHNDTSTELDRAAQTNAATTKDDVIAVGNGGNHDNVDEHQQAKDPAAAPPSNTLDVFATKPSNIRCVASNGKVAMEVNKIGVKDTNVDAVPTDNE